MTHNDIRQEYAAAVTEIVEHLAAVDDHTRAGGLDFVDDVRPHLRNTTTEHADTSAPLSPRLPEPKDAVNAENERFNDSGLPWVEPKDWTPADQAREDGQPNTWLIQ